MSSSSSRSHRSSGSRSISRSSTRSTEGADGEEKGRTKMKRKYIAGIVAASEIEVLAGG
jgi:hypothetical protein